MKERKKVRTPRYKTLSARAVRHSKITIIIINAAVLYMWKWIFLTVPLACESSQGKDQNGATAAPPPDPYPTEPPGNSNGSC